MFINAKTMLSILPKLHPFAEVARCNLCCTGGTQARRLHLGGNVINEVSFQGYNGTSIYCPSSESYVDVGDLPRMLASLPNWPGYFEPDNDKLIFVGLDLNRPEDVWSYIVAASNEIDLTPKDWWDIEDLYLDFGLDDIVKIVILDHNGFDEIDLDLDDPVAHIENTIQGGAVPMFWIGFMDSQPLDTMYLVMAKDEDVLKELIKQEE